VYAGMMTFRRPVNLESASNVSARAALPEDTANAVRTLSPRASSGSKTLLR